MTEYADRVAMRADHFAQIPAILDDLATLERRYLETRYVTSATDPPDSLPTLIRGVQLALSAAVTALGECRLDVPYAPMQPVNDSNGFRWCCTHNPTHCSS